ncbi:hypothetical protein [Amycolatopsis sp. cmx-11-51]|uniref:hypothetical protein n=1 Tax=unclassified Amycolatopsis TaxID=2618356 RepID=UPI0039E2481A
MARRRVGFVFAVIASVIALLIFVVFAVLRIVDVSVPVGSAPANIPVVPECRLSIEQIDRLGVTNPTTSYTLRGEDVRLTVCDYDTLKGANGVSYRALSIRVREYVHMAAADQDYIVETRILAGSQPLALAGASGVQGLWQRSDLATAIAVVRAGSRVIRVQYDGYNKGFFGRVPADHQEIESAAQDVTYSMVTMTQ